MNTLFFVLLLSCNTSVSDISSSEKGMCSAIEEKRNLLQSVIDIPDIQQFYYKNEIEKNGLFIERSSLLNDSLNLFKYGQKVNIVSKDKLLKNGIVHYLNIYYSVPSDSIHYEKGDVPKLINENNRLPNKVHINLVYEAQGMECFATLRKKKECEWELIYTNVFER